MVELVEASMDELKTIVRPHRGRISYPIIKMFMESGMYCARVTKLETLGERRMPGQMSSLLNCYCKNHGIPVKASVHNGELYLYRLDIDRDGNKIEDWSHTIRSSRFRPREEPEELNDEHIRSRAQGEYD